MIEQEKNLIANESKKGEWFTTSHMGVEHAKRKKKKKKKKKKKIKGKEEEGHAQLI